MDIRTFRHDLTAWLDAHADELTPPFEGNGTLDEQMAQYRLVKGALWEADFGRYGWPEAVGGLGGPSMFRAVVGEEIAGRELADPSIWTMIEVLAPTISAFGSPELVADMVPRFLRGEELWCQGFSEPGAGSDLASLTCRAAAVDGGWLVNGQKVWTSYAQYAQRCVLLDPHRRARQRPSGHHRVLRRHGLARHRPEPDRGPARSVRVRRGVLRRRVRARRAPAR